MLQERRGGEQFFHIEPAQNLLRSLCIGESYPVVYLENISSPYPFGKAHTTKLTIKKNSCVQYIVVLSDDIQDDFIENRSISIEDWAKADMYYFYFGGKHNTIQTHLKIARHAVAHIFVYFFGTAEQKFEFKEIFELQKAASYLRVSVKGLAAGRAFADYQGNIRVGKTAQETDSRLEIQSFIFDSRAQCHMVPKLEILANNVKAGHAASISKIGDEELFYLRSRGLNKKQALELFIEGVFLDALKDIGSQKVAQTILEIVKRKFGKIIL